MDDDQQFCLRWNNHQSTLISVFDTLLENGTLVDCTLAAEGKFLKAHKVVLSACSPYFAALLSQQYDKHPIFILKDVKFQELRAMMDYMYRGEVNISQDQLAALLKAAESLQIKGLSDSRGSSGSGGSSQKADTSTKTHASVPAAKQTSTGLTIEQKRPRIEKQHPATLDTEPDVSDSREGSTSPNSRKRKKFRRRSIETNNIGDNHDQHSNSSSHSMPHAALSTHTTSMPTITSATSSASVLNVTKKTDHQSHESKGDIERDVDDSGDARADGGETHPLQVSRSKQSAAHGGETESTAKDKMEHSTHPDMLLEPKNEYDESNDGNVEDLTLDDEELLEDLEQAGPSHGGGEGSSQGYAQWQIERSQDEVFMAGQEAAGQHRDAQDPLGDLEFNGEHDVLLQENLLQIVQINDDDDEDVDVEELRRCDIKKLHFNSQGNLEWLFNTQDLWKLLNLKHEKLYKKAIAREMLSKQDRLELSKMIIGYLLGLDKDIQVGKYAFLQICRAILEVFPLEKEEYYFEPWNNGRPATGSLYVTYHRLRFWRYPGKTIGDRKYKKTRYAKPKGTSKAKSTKNKKKSQ